MPSSVSVGSRPSDVDDALVFVAGEAVSFEDGVVIGRRSLIATRLHGSRAVRQRLAATDSNSDEAVGAAERQLAGALRMRHQADDVAPLVADAGDVVRPSRSDWPRRVTSPSRVRVAEDDLAVLLEPRDDVRLRVVVALAVGDRHAQHLAGAAGER